MRRGVLCSVGLSVLAASMAGGCTPNVSERDIVGVELPTVLEASRRTSPDLLIDARAPSRYRRGHLPGAISLGIAQINTEGRRRPDLLEARRLVVYGQNPGDTLASGLTLRLLEAGYDSAVLFRGGVEAWLAAGYALESDESSATTGSASPSD